MKCERCSMDGTKTEFRVRSDILDLKVCSGCASEARTLTLMVEPLMAKRPGSGTTRQKDMTDSELFAEGLSG